ncbi:MAG: hypothetical protein IJ793_01060 [Opitutales bacterium]|nr:hypothetical protein [Opitutales bacterium]
MFILISSWRQGHFASSIVKCMEANAQRLRQFDAEMTIAVRCDGETEDNGKAVLSKDIWAYAEALNEAKVAFRVRESERVKVSDFVYSHHKPDEAHWELVTNERNLGCSGTRHAGIDAIEKAVKELLKKGERVYIGIFDGDDFIHPDFYLLLTANAIHTGATVSNYNGKIGAHGLQKASLLRSYDKPFFGLTAKKERECYQLYRGKNKFGQNELDAGREKELGGVRKGNSSLSGICCTTKIFEAKYFYDKLDALAKQQPNGNRHAIDLLTLTPLDGFNNEACTCVTEKSLFFYNEKGKVGSLMELRYLMNPDLLEDDTEEEASKKEPKDPDYRSYFKIL